MAADVVGSSRLMEADEEYAFAAIQEVLSDVLVARALRHGGRLVKNTGDGALLEFASPAAAVSCADEVQRELEGRAAPEPEARRVRLRIGVNTGDVIVKDDGDLYGDGVNVAARLEGIAQPGGICISEKVFDELRSDIKKSFIDKGSVSLKNISRPVRVYASSEHRSLMKPTITHQGERRLSLAVLPFDNLHGDSDQDYFADALVDGLTSDIALHVNGLYVVGRGSAFSYKRRDVDSRQIGRDLGVRYILRGSVQRSGSRVRVNGFLVDVSTGAQLWTERFDGDSSDLISLQDDITARIANSLGLALYTKEANEAEVRSGAHPDVVDLVLRGWAAFYLGDRTRSAFDAAEPFYRAALEIEPENADAVIGLGAVLAGGLFNFRQYETSPDQRRIEVDAALDLVNRGLAVQPRSAVGHAARGILFSVDKRWREALPMFELAHSLDPISMLFSVNLANNHLALGDPEEALRILYEASRRSPRDPAIGILHAAMGRCYLHLSRWDEAIHSSLRARSTRLASWLPVHTTLAASFAQLASYIQAAESLRDALLIEPKLSLSWLRANNFSLESSYMRLAEATLMDGLRKAGVPEHATI